MCHVLRLIEIKSGNRYFFWNEKKKIELTTKKKKKVVLRSTKTVQNTASNFQMNSVDMNVECVYVYTRAYEKKMLVVH